MSRKQKDAQDINDVSSSVADDCCLAMSQESTPGREVILEPNLFARYTAPPM
jgi:hypothetical protein